MRILSYLTVAAIALSAVSCGKQDSKTESKLADETAFYASQPIESGQYRAVNYNITGANERKGHFDGRMLIALDPERSGLYVYENGNRTKIDYRVMLAKPFERGDSGVYNSTDTEGRPVTIRTDSTVYTLSFQKKDSHVSIGFESKPMSTGTPYDIWQRISDAISKK